MEPVIRISADVCRVYYNRSKVEGKAWSVDFGPGTAEILVRWVELCDVCAMTILDEANIDPNKPSGWVQIQGAVVEIAKGSATIRTRR